MTLEYWFMFPAATLISAVATSVFIIAFTALAGSAGHVV